jgi:hypothetical protein
MTVHEVFIIGITFRKESVLLHGRLSEKELTFDVPADMRYCPLRLTAQVFNTNGFPVSSYRRSGVS